MQQTGCTYNLNSPIVQDMIRRGVITPEMQAKSNFVYGNPPVVTTERVPIVEADLQPPLLVNSSPVITRINPVGAPPVYPDLPSYYQESVQSPTVVEVNNQYTNPASMVSQVQQPYPDPYGMITNTGLMNYNLPTFNFSGALATPGAPAPNGYITAPPVPAYADYRQPVQGLPIQNYSNPYMNPGYIQPPQDFRTVGYAQGYNPYAAQPFNNIGWSPFGPYGVQPTEEDKKRIMRYRYGTDEDRKAIEEGFDSAIHSMINDLHIATMMNVAAAKTPEEKARIQANADEYEEYLRKMDEIEQERCDPFNLKRYEPYQHAEVKPMNVKIVKGGKVIAERNPEVAPKKVHPIKSDIELANQSAYNINLQEWKNRRIAEIYMNAPERQLDNMSLLECFNNGWGILIEAERKREFAMLEAKSLNVNRLYDSKEFQLSFYKHYGTPQQRQKIYEMEQKLLIEATKPKSLRELAVGPEYWGRSVEQEDEDNEDDYLPGPGEPGFDPMDPRHAIIKNEDGSTTITVPPWIYNKSGPGICDTFGLTPEQMMEAHHESIEYKEGLSKWMEAVDEM